MKFLIRASLILGGLVFSLLPVSAAEIAAQKMVASPPIKTLKQLEAYNYRVGFKNIGDSAWSNVGTGRLTIKTTQDIRYEHWFASRYWLDKLTVAPLDQALVQPGEIGFFTLRLEAPKRAKTFTNTFAVFAGDNKIAETDFTLKITVTNNIFNNPAPVAVAPPTSNPAPQTATPATNAVEADLPIKKLQTKNYAKGAVLIRSTQTLELNPGEVTSFTVGLKNTGERNWRNAAPSKTTLEINTSSMEKTLSDGSWPTRVVAAILPPKLAKPGSLTFFTIKLKAPMSPGSYLPSFYLVLNDNILIEGTEFKLPIIVKTPTPASLASSASPIGSSSTVVCLAAQEPGDPNSSGTCNPPRKEPIIRVGIDKLENQLGVTSDKTYIVIDSTGKVYKKIAAGLTTFMAYDETQKIYTAVGPGPVIRSSLPLRVKAEQEPSIITLTTFINPVNYKPGWNDNKYRGAIELQWSDSDEKLWIINELKMEEYLKGLAESSNKAPAEYQKALVTAARSYALYHLQTGTKHKKRNFHVKATVADQYYRGYESEKRLPAVVEAVKATRGQVVTYNGAVVITPYSASTDGMTRTWSEVWGGSDKPWLIKKAVPEDANRKKFGHAVGLSQLAAADQARAGKQYIDILKFFYVGTEVAQWYN